jgi:hypothetical protein
MKGVEVLGRSLYGTLCNFFLFVGLLRSGRIQEET